MTYVELATDELKNRGQVAELALVSTPAFIREHHRRSVWRSYFTFDERIKDFLHDKAALNSSYGYTIGLDRIRLDFEKPGDDGSHLEETRREVYYMIEHLLRDMDVQMDWVQVWFSGMKGFHVDLPNLFGLQPSPALPHLLKASLKATVGHPFLDLKPVHAAGLIRLEWTRHHKTGLHKIPLSLQELKELQVEVIREMASAPEESRRGFILAGFEDVEPVWKKEAVTVRVPARLSFGQKGITIQHDPTSVVTCMQKLAARGAVPGRRHTDMLRLASWMWRGGVPKEWTRHNLYLWAGPTGMSLSEIAKHVDTVYDAKKYLYSCHDEVMREFCDERCIYHKLKDYAVTLSDSNQMARGLKDFLEKVHKRGLGFDFRDLFPQWGHGKEPYRVVPGEVFMLTGDTGMTKTAWAQWLILKLRQRTAWLNLEMAEHLVFRRFLQMEHGMSKYEVESLFLKESEEDLLPLTEPLDFIKCMSTAPTVDQMERIVQQLEPEILVVDTSDAIEVPGAGNNEMYQLKKVIEMMRFLAQKYQIIVLPIHHISKQGSRAINGEERAGKTIIRRETSLNDLSGNRATVTKADHVFCIEGERRTPRRLLRSLKTRDNEPVEVKLQVNFRAFTFTEPALEGNPFGI